jgi:Protein of unknown function (DUF2934)
MKSSSETLEVRIRERAYHIWEASGRPPGRDKEFWQQAYEQVAVDEIQPSDGSHDLQPRKRQAAQGGQDASESRSVSRLHIRRRFRYAP